MEKGVGYRDQPLRTCSAFPPDIEVHGLPQLLNGEYCRIRFPGVKSR